MHEIGDRRDTAQVAARVLEHLECGRVEEAQPAVHLEHREERARVLDERAVEHRGLHRLFGHDARGDVAAPHEHVFGRRHFVEHERDVAVRAFGAAHPRVHFGGGLAAVAHRAEVVEHDDEVGGVDEVEERRALEVVGGVAGDAAEVVAAREADAAVGVEDGDRERVDDGRGSSRVARLRHAPASRCRSRRPACCPQPGYHMACTPEHPP